jgi:two-component system, LytTR family, sensor kinase
MKKLTILLFCFCCFLHLIGQEKLTWENTTWKVIRERLFNGKNTRAFRYEEDIRIKLEGAESAKDSAIVLELIEELNGLIETVEVCPGQEDANFSITLLPDDSEAQFSTYGKISGSEIIYTRLELKRTELHKREESLNALYYYSFRNLTRVFEPRHGHTGYGGIFDSSEPDNARINEIDRDLIRKLYSHTFYKDLKQNTIKNRGYLSYLHLRYQSWLGYIAVILGIVFSVFLFSAFLSGKAWTNRKVAYWNYLLTGVLISIFLTVVYVFFIWPQHTGMLTKNMLLGTLKLNAMAIIPYGFLASTLMFLIEKFFIHKREAVIQTLMIVFLSTIFSIIAVGLVVFKIIFSILTSLIPPEGFSSNSLNIILIPVLIIGVVIAGLRLLFYILNYRLQHMVNQKDLEIARIRELKNQAELHALHSRINPHFLYNSLNSIAGLAHTDPDKTEKMAVSLSDLFRYSINREDKTYATVGEELNMVSKYLEVEKVRFGSRLDYRIDADEHLLDKEIPKFLLQPLVENAIKHGLTKITGQGVLRVEIKQAGKDLVIRVFDNGTDFPEEPVGGYGLQNLHDKLQILFGDDAIINWQNGKNKHIQVTLRNQM